jgi:hypothetical protein
VCANQSRNEDTPPTPLRSNHTNIELLTLVLTFGKDGERSSHGGRTGPRTTISRVSYRESTYARLKEWNQLPMNMAVFLMAVLLYACGHGAACCAALTVDAHHDAQILNMISNIELMIVVLILTRVTCGHSQPHAGERTSCPSHTRQS